MQAVLVCRFWAVVVDTADGAASCWAGSIVNWGKTSRCWTGMALQSTLLAYAAISEGGTGTHD
jgi:hypothetical protein